MQAIPSALQLRFEASLRKKNAGVRSCNITFALPVALPLSPLPGRTKKSACI